MEFFSWPPSSHGHNPVPLHLTWGWNPTFILLTPLLYKRTLGGGRRAGSGNPSLGLTLLAGRLCSMSTWSGVGVMESQYSQLSMPRVEFLPYEWEPDGKRQPWSSWLCLPGIELLQYKFGGGAGGEQD